MPSLSWGLTGKLSDSASMRFAKCGCLNATRLLLLLFGILIFAGPRAVAVTTVDDDTEETLNQAIADAAGDDGVIVFTGDFSISLSAPITIDPDALLASTNGFILDAQGHKVSVHGDTGVRVFEALNGANVIFNGLTIADGQTNQGAGLFIDSDSTASLTNCVFINNKVTGTNGADGTAGANSGSGSGGNGHAGLAGETVAGGAIYNLGTSLSLYNCVISSNTATGGSGGAGGNGGSGPLNAGSGGNGGAAGSARGGGIYCANTNADLAASDFIVVISNCTFSANSAIAGNGGAGGTAGASGLGGMPGSGGAGGVASGGGLLSSNPVIVVASTFSGNAATGGNSAGGGTQSNGNGVSGAAGGAATGAGIAALDSVITNCTFYLNNASGGAGGNGGPGSGNAGNGGNGGAATGAGFYSTGAADVISCTFSNCNATGGTNGVAGSPGVGGVNGSIGASRGGDIARGGTPRFVLAMTILATNTSGGAGYNLTATDDYGNNLYFGSSITLSGSSIKTNNAKLGPLANNGGPTMTMLPLAGSPALDRISAGFPPTDQRGIPRPINVSADIGAVELEQNIGPPVITGQPTNPAVSLGSNATIFVTAVGSPTLKYYWLSNSFLASTQLLRTSFVISNAAPSNAGPYTVIVSNSLNTATSTPVTVKFIPSITNQPSSVGKPLGAGATFLVGVVADTNGLTYQWQLSGQDVPFATGSQLQLTNIQTSDSGPYTVIISNIYGSTVSTQAFLNISPGIISQTTNVVVTLGLTTNLFVNAGGTALTYQWRFNSNVLGGNNGSSYTVGPAQTNDAGTYDVIITNSFGSITSSPITVSIVEGASISTQPQSTTNAAGSIASFSVVAAGPSLSYQWERNSFFIPNATSSTLSLTNVQLSQTGAYQVVVSNPNSSITSSIATLTVIAPPPVLHAGYATGKFTLSFLSASGFSYVVESRTNILTGIWSSNSSLLGTGGVQSLVFTPSNKASFFRVHTQ